MAFSDPDPIEQDMGVLCEDMTPDQLVTYIKTFNEAYGRKLTVEGYMERAVFKGMKRIYGDKTAGLIVKWVFYHHKGVWNGNPVGFFDFAKGSKWWVDKMHVEMQAMQQAEISRPAEQLVIGARKLSSL